MNKLVIIGNGFDLAHGLKTSYKDFILWHIDKVFKLPFGQRESGLIKIETNIDYTDITSVEEYRKIKSYDNSDYKFNVKGKHIFISDIIDEIETYNWVDIERMYFRRLLVYPDLSVTEGKKKIEMVKELNKFMDLIKNELIEYLLISLPKQCDIDNEIFNHFSEILDTSNFSESKFQFNILYFNYTDTIEKYVKNNYVNYIHGKLNDNNIIFGYGDETDERYVKIEKLNSNTYLRHMKSFAYLQTSNYKKLFQFLDTDKFDVYIMGHSCGLSDRLLFTHIFEHVNFNSVKIYYHQKSETENDFFEKTQNLSRYFQIDSKHKMRTKVVPFGECKPLVSFKPKQTN